MQNEMVVKIRLKHGPVFRHESGQERRWALAIAGVLSPASFIAAVFACWRLAADLHWTGKFAITSGPFSHWQIWTLMAVILQILASRLNRYGHRDSPLP